jgi:hypothetical protein
MAVKGIVRLTALAVATGTLVAAGAGTATAATAVDTSQIVAAGDGAAIKITLNLPAQLAGVLGTETIEQTISMTDGSVSTVTTPLAETTAVLGKGNVPVLSDLLAKTTKASLSGKTEDSSGSPLDIDQLGLKLRLLPLVSKVAQPTADGVLSASESGVAQLRIGALGAAGLDTVTAPVQDVLDTALGTVDTVAGTATGTVGSALTGALDQLDAATDNGSAPLTGAAAAAVEDATDTLEATLDGLVDTLGSLDAATDLVSMDTIFSNQAITRKGDVVTSTVENTVKNLNVLNGLVKVEAITSKATAAAGGKPGTADADFTAPVLNVSVANGALTAILDENGLNLGGTVGEALPADLAGTVNGALDTVSGLLNELAGVDVVIGQGTKTVSPDGTAAAASVAATTLVVNPPVLATLIPAGKKFLTVELVRANASAGTRLVAAPAVPTVPVAVNTPTSLPRTGGELGLAAAATVLMGVALVARRRRSVFVG